MASSCGPRSISSTVGTPRCDHIAICMAQRRGRLESASVSLHEHRRRCNSSRLGMGCCRGIECEGSRTERCRHATRWACPTGRSVGLVLTRGRTVNDRLFGSCEHSNRSDWAVRAHWPGTSQAEKCPARWRVVGRLDGTGGWRRFVCANGGSFDRPDRCLHGSSSKCSAQSMVRPLRDTSQTK